MADDGDELARRLESLRKWESANETLEQVVGGSGTALLNSPTTYYGSRRGWSP